MLPIGLNMCTPGDQELISLAKTRYLLVRRDHALATHLTWVLQCENTAQVNPSILTLKQETATFHNSKALHLPPCSCYCLIERHRWRGQRPYSTESASSRKGERVEINSLTMCGNSLPKTVYIVFYILLCITHSVRGPCSEVAAKPVQGHSDEKRGPSRPWEGGGSYPEDLCCCLQPGAGRAQTFIRTKTYNELQITLKVLVSLNNCARQ